MRKIVLILGLAVLTGGCSSIVRKDGDSFEMTAANYEAFTRDDATCAQVAETAVTGDPRLVDNTSYARTRAYNQLYGACMVRAGYRPRPYVKNLLPEVAW